MNDWLAGALLLMGTEPVFVIGTSEGGVTALQELLSALPEDFPRAVLVVLHVGAHRSNLPWLLNQRGPLQAVHPNDGDAITAGHIYIAPPDHHMIVERGNIHLTKGPRENWARPAIDPLFRSAAKAYGPNAVGVILTGGLNDGTAGLYEIKKRGGITVVQSPDDACNPSMPQSAIDHVTIDHCIPLADMPKLLVRLAGAKVQEVVGYTADEDKEMTAEFTQNHPVAITCPDCGGALRKTELGALSQFRCHIGHVYTAEVMLAAQFLALERALETAMRSLSERAELCRQMAEKTNDRGTVANWETAMHEATDQKLPIETLLTRQWIHPHIGRTER